MSVEKFDNEGNLDPVYEYIEEIAVDVIKDMFKSGRIRIDLAGSMGNEWSNDKDIIITPELRIDGELVYVGRNAKFKFKLNVIEGRSHSDVFIERKDIFDKSSEIVEGRAISGPCISGLDLSIENEYSY